MPSHHYPLFLNIAGKRCLVVGGGGVAERKVVSLLEAGAAVTVVSPALTARLKRLREKGSIIHIARSFRKGDCRGAFLVVAATDDAELNRQVAAAAPCLVNVVDGAGAGNCIMPASWQEEPLTVAVSTNGVSPALAASIRDDIAARYGADPARYLKALAALRAGLHDAVPDRKRREEILRLLGSPEMLDLLCRDGYRKAVQQARKQIKASLRERSAERNRT